MAERKWMNFMTNLRLVKFGFSENLTDVVADFLKVFHQDLFLLRTHPGKDHGPDTNPRKVLVISNDLEAMTVHGKYIPETKIIVRGFAEGHVFEHFASL